MAIAHIIALQWSAADSCQFIFQIEIVYFACAPPFRLGILLKLFYVLVFFYFGVDVHIFLFLIDLIKFSF